MKSPVLKNVLAAVLGYVVMFAVSFPLFALMWMVLGASGSFEQGSWDVSGSWIGSSIVLGAIVSITGGFTCSKLAASRQGVAMMLGLVIAVGVVGIVSGMPNAAAVPGVRPDDVSMFDAMMSAERPTWMLWLDPVVGVMGVVLGAMLEARKGAAERLARPPSKLRGVSGS